MWGQSIQSSWRFCHCVSHDAICYMQWQILKCIRYTETCRNIVKMKIGVRKQSYSEPVLVSICFYLSILPQNVPSLSPVSWCVCQPETQQNIVTMLRKPIFKAKLLERQKLKIFILSKKYIILLYGVSLVIFCTLSGAGSQCTEAKWNIWGIS